MLGAQIGNAKEKKIENQNYLFYLLIFHKNPKQKKVNSKAKTNKIELLSKEMNMNHEIVFFQDIDYNNSSLFIRMMLKSQKKIKRYKEVELKVKELSIKTYEKKILKFPFNSKLIFNYNLTNDKNTISSLIKDSKAKSIQKRQKSIFEGDDADEDLQEESENSDEEKNNSNSSSKNVSGNNLVKVEDKKDEPSTAAMNFRQRLSIFEKKGGPPQKKLEKYEPNKLNQNNAIKERINKLNLIHKNIEKKDNKNENINNNNISNNKKNENIKNNEIIPTKEEINKDIKKNENNKNSGIIPSKKEINKDFKKNEIIPVKKEINKDIKNSEINKHNEMISAKKEINKDIKKSEINKHNDIISAKKEINKDDKKNENNININRNNIKEILEKNNSKKLENNNKINNYSNINIKKNENKNEIKKKNDNINKNEIPKKSEIHNNNSIIKKISVNSHENERNNNILKANIININEEFNLESFCKCFFICSFPYHNGKVMEDSKQYQSMCNHQMCSKLIAMEPEIIYKYPLNDPYDLELNNLSASICFPTGIKICYSQDNRDIYKSFSTHIMNQQGQKYYMTIYHFYRQLEQMIYNKLYIDNPLKIYLRQFGENTYRNKAEKKLLEKDLEECQELGFREYVYIPYAFVLVSKYPYINQMKSCLNIIYKIIANDKEILNNFDAKIKSSLINDLLAYLIYGIPIPKINTEISFNMPLTSNKIKIPSPFNGNAQSLENINFCDILSKFCTDNILKIYKLMLFEQKLLFIDEDINRLSSVIGSFINILYPIDWVNSTIPIMSAQMIRYLQTFLPFINGISENLYEHRAKSTLAEAEEGVFLINIKNDTVAYTKNNGEDILASIPNLPDEIYKKLYSELYELSEVYNNLPEKNNEKREKYSNIVNMIAKNIFLESVCLMLYELMNYILENQNDFNGFSTDILVNIYDKDACFYKELTDTQIFQNFIQNFIKKKKDYSLFICMLKNITEKYVKNYEKPRFIWRKFVRKIEQKDLQAIPQGFKIPNHLLNHDYNLNSNYIIDKHEWIDINNTLKNKDKTIDLSNDIIHEKNRIAFIINNIKPELYPSNQKIERFILLTDQKRQKEKNKLLALDYVKEKEILRKDSDLSKEDLEKIKNDFTDTIACILKNDPNAKIEFCLKNIYFDFGREIFGQLIFKQGFKVVRRLNEQCFKYLAQIIINGFVSTYDNEDNQNMVEFAVKITSSAFCFCKENCDSYLLIDELRNILGKDYFMWNKTSFWNIWQHLEGYFTIEDYRTYCQIIVHDISHKLLRLKLDKDFIKNYLLSSLKEKLSLLEHDGNVSQKEKDENQSIFKENEQNIIDIIKKS